MLTQSRILLDLGRHEHSGAGMWVYGRGIAEAALEASLPVEVTYRQDDPEWEPSVQLDRWHRKGESALGRRASLFLDPYSSVKGYDLVHGMANTVPLRGEGKRIVTVHDLFQAYPVYAPDSFYEKARTAFYRYYFSQLFKRVDYVLCDLDLIRTEIIERFAPKCPVEVLAPGLHDVYLEAPLPENDESSGYFLLFSSSDKRKNIERALDACAGSYSPGDTFVVVVGSDAQRMSLREGLPKKLSQEGVVDIRVGIPTEEMPALYRNASGLIFPSLAEGFGYPLYEALSQGTPVVFTPEQLPQALIDEFPEFCFAADPQRTDSIAECINDLTHTPRVAEQKRSVAEFIRKRYTFSTCVARLREIYSDVIEERGK